MGRGLQALPCLDLCQQLRIVSGGGHHVEGFSACREKVASEIVHRDRQDGGTRALKQGGREGQGDFSVLNIPSMENAGQ